MILIVGFLKFSVDYVESLSAVVYNFSQINITKAACFKIYLYICVIREDIWIEIINRCAKVYINLDEFHFCSPKSAANIDYGLDRIDRRLFPIFTVFRDALIKWITSNTFMDVSLRSIAKFGVQTWIDDVNRWTFSVHDYTKSILAFCTVCRYSLWRFLPMIFLFIRNWPSWTLLDPCPHL